MNISLNPKKLLIILLGVTFVLLVANIISVLFLNYLGSNPELEFAYSIKYLPLQFNFNTEKNVPTYFSSLLLLLSASLLFLIGLREKFENKRFLAWYGLSVIFLFLSFDEMTAVHETLIQATRQKFNLSGLFYYAWVIPYGLAVLVLGAIYIKFLIRLPRKTSQLFFLSAIVFITGAIILELPAGLIDEKYGQGPLYRVLYTIEELLEMIGVIIFIYALTSYKKITINTV